jgi:type IX secretion system PorP/SprF family membrane protein
MKAKKLILGVIGSSLCMFVTLSAVVGQQMPHYSTFDKNLYGLNPAYGGMDLNLTATGIYRSQWNSIEGQPERYHFNGHLPVFAWLGGAGLLLETERIGPRRWTQFALSYNYVMSSDYGVFSFGLRPGFRSWSFDGSLLTTPGGSYEDGAINHEDPVLSAQSLGATQFNVDVGIHFKGYNVNAGVFAQQILPSTAQLSQDFGYDANIEWGLYGIYNYAWQFNIDWQPALLIISDGQRTQSTLKVGALFSETYYAQAGLRGYSGNSIDAFVIGGGIQLSEEIWAYFNLDLGLSAFRNVHSGSQEIIIRYNFLGDIGGVMPPRVIYNPRLM